MSRVHGEERNVFSIGQKESSPMIERVICNLTRLAGAEGCHEQLGRTLLGSREHKFMIWRKAQSVAGA